MESATILTNLTGIPSGPVDVSEMIKRNRLFDVFLSVMSIICLRNLEIRFARLFIFFILLWIKCPLEFYCQLLKTIS